MVGGWRNLRWKCGRGVLICVLSSSLACSSQVHRLQHLFQFISVFASSPLLPFNSFLMYPVSIPSSASRGSPAHSSFFFLLQVSPSCVNKHSSSQAQLHKSAHCSPQPNKTNFCLLFLSFILGLFPSFLQQPILLRCEDNAAQNFGTNTRCSNQI